MGFDLSEFSARTVVVQGTPPGVEAGQEQEILESILEQYKQNRDEFRLHRDETLARIMARRTSVRHGQKLAPREMRNLVDELFASGKPASAPDGRPVFLTFSLEELAAKFK